MLCGDAWISIYVAQETEALGAEKTPSNIEYTCTPSSEEVTSPGTLDGGVEGFGKFEKFSFQSAVSHRRQCANLQYFREHRNECRIVFYIH